MAFTHICSHPSAALSPRVALWRWSVFPASGIFPTGWLQSGWLLGQSRQRRRFSCHARQLVVGMAAGQPRRNAKISALKV